MGTLYGVLLRQNSPYSEDDPYTPLDILHQATFAMCGSSKYRMATYKIRIPELHFMLPVPKNPLNPSEMDQIIIDCYPTVQAIDTNVMKKQVRPGDIVKVEMANRGSISRLYYSGPVDGDGTTLPWVAGPSSPPYNYGQLLEECKKKYSNAGSRGDVIGKGENIVKINSGAPLIIKGMGTSENKIITGTIHKKWLFDLFRRLKSEDKYKGLVWLGVCKNNGREDQEFMLSDNGLKSPNGKGGRSTVIYMPSSTDPSSPLEIIYWFHDALGFKNDTVEWNKLWLLLKGMSKKNSTLGGARRNFVFVVPEMLWSEEGSTPYSSRAGTPRTTHDPLTSKAIAAAKPVKYRNREWAAWGFDGIPAVPSLTRLKILESPEFIDTALDSKSGANAKVPIPWVDMPYDFRDWNNQNSIGSPPSPEVVGDMVPLHEEVLGILKDQFGVPGTGDKFVTLVGHKKGGIAIANLARMDKLGKGDGQLHASKISFVHGDYAVQNNRESNSIMGANWYHGGDLYEIIKKIDTTTKLEIHLAWGPNTDIRPKRAAGALIGGLYTALKNHHYDYDGALLQLETLYQYTWGRWHPSIWHDPTLGLGHDHSWHDYIVANNLLLHETFVSGYKMIEGRTEGTLQLPPPFSNVVYKGWPSTEAIGALAWLPADAPTSVATVKEESAMAKMEKTQHIDENLTANIKNAFKGFDGQLILYTSEKVGPSKTVAILVPKGASVKENYELIYYLHGDIGLNGATKIFQPALKNQFNIMVANQRNVVIVLADIDPNPINASSTLWGLGSDPNAKPPTYTFSEFHQEVINKMVEKWQPEWMDVFGDYGPGTAEYAKWEEQWELDEGLNKDEGVKETAPPDPAPFMASHYAQPIPAEYLIASPSFITIKAHTGASRMLGSIIDDMSNKNFTVIRTKDQWTFESYADFEEATAKHAPIMEQVVTPLRRIDLLNANWGPEYGIIKRIYNTWPKGSTKPGEEFEIQMVAGPYVFGPKKVPALTRAQKYMAGGKDAKTGLWVDPTEAPNATLPFKFFSSPSKLGLDFPKIPPPELEPEDPLEMGSAPGQGAPSAPPVPLKFDKKGKAYDLTGKRMPAYDLKKEAAFVKGFLKNHTPSTEQIGGTMGCEVLSRKTYGLTKVAVMTPAEGAYKCKTNPLGLVDFNTQSFNSIKISPTRSEYSWGSTALSEYFKGLDQPFWTQTGNQSRPTIWVVKDISPQGTNGVDKVRGHDSHN